MQSERRGTRTAQTANNSHQQASEGSTVVENVISAIGLMQKQSSDIADKPTRWPSMRPLKRHALAMPAEGLP